MKKNLLLSLFVLITLNLACSSDSDNSDGLDTLSPEIQSTLNNYQTLEEALYEKLYGSNNNESPPPDERVFDRLKNCNVNWNEENHTLDGESCPIYYEIAIGIEGSPTKFEALDESFKVLLQILSFESRSSFREEGTNDNFQQWINNTLNIETLNNAIINIETQIHNHFSMPNFTSTTELKIYKAEEANKAFSPKIVASGKLIDDTMEINNITCYLNSRPISCQELARRIGDAGPITPAQFLNKIK